jgi:hypothetical protein
MKNISWVNYAACALALLFLDGPFATAAGWVLTLIFAAHFVEFLVKRDVMAKAGGSMGHHFVQTMIYGFFHWRPLEEQQRSGN